MDTDKKTDRKPGIKTTSMAPDKLGIYYKEIENYKKRDCFDKMKKFIEVSQGVSGRILVLYGLKSTGKTTLMRQLAHEYGIDHIYRAKEGQSINDVYEQLDVEKAEGARIVFIDEITNVIDLTVNSAFLADKYASSGMDIVISGNDSLEFDLAERDELFDRTYPINTTYISFAEFSRLFGSDDIDEYIRYGGLMRECFMDADAMYEKTGARRYLDSAVAGNIYRSLNKAPEAPQYSELRKYSEKALQTIIHKMAELYNGVIDSDLHTDYAGQKNVDDIAKMFADKYKGIPEQAKYSSSSRKKLMEEYAGIINAECLVEHPVTVEFVEEFEYTLLQLGVLSSRKSRLYTLDRTAGEWNPPVRSDEKLVVQPTVRYSLLREAKNAIINSSATQNLSPDELNELDDRLENIILGKLLEDTVSLDVTAALSSKDYFICKTTFVEGNTYRGKYGLYIADKKTKKGYAFEIKHSSTVHERHDKNLINPDFKAVNERWTGYVLDSTYILYNGKSCVNGNNIPYFNIAEFLKDLQKTHDLEQTIISLMSTM